MYQTAAALLQPETTQCHPAAKPFFSLPARAFLFLIKAAMGSPSRSCSRSIRSRSWSSMYRASGFCISFIASSTFCCCCLSCASLKTHKEFHRQAKEPLTVTYGFAGWVRVLRFRCACSTRALEGITGGSETRQHEAARRASPFSPSGVLLVSLRRGFSFLPLLQPLPLQVPLAPGLVSVDGLGVPGFLWRGHATSHAVWNTLQSPGNSTTASHFNAFLPFLVLASESACQAKAGGITALA